MGWGEEKEGMSPIARGRQGMHVLKHKTRLMCMTQCTSAQIISPARSTLEANCMLLKCSTFDCGINQISLILQSSLCLSFHALVTALDTANAYKYYHKSL